MASPGPLSQPQPLTPPAEPSQQSNNTTAPSSTAPHQRAAPTSHSTTSGSAPNASTTTTNPNPAVPLTSLSDTGLTKRPRDARLIHLILSSMGVSAYQERVPLQLLDFAYRYTSSVLGDALHIQAEGYDAADTSGPSGKGRGRGGGGGASANTADNADSGKGTADGGISLTALRMAIGSRTQYQFQQGMPKEFLVELAAKRNAIGLPGSTRGGANTMDAGVSVGGVRLPPEKYCLSGTGWGLKESWDSEGEEDEEGDAVNGLENGAGGRGDVEMGEDVEDGLDGEEDEDDREGMEALFGKTEDGAGEGADGDGDQEMGDG